MRRIVSLLIVLLVALPAPPAESSVTHFTVNRDEPLAGLTVVVPCTGDSIGFTEGELHDLFALTISGSHFSVTIHGQPFGLKGTDGAGRRYVGVGITREHDSGSFGDGRVATSFVNTFDLVGLDGAPSYRTHETVHLTITPLGVITVDRASLRVTCDA